MIRKIHSSEILKRYDQMSEAERGDYLKRVGEWLDGDGKRLLLMTERPMARAQSILQLSTRWSKEDCNAFQQGVILLSAHIDRTETWLPAQLYHKAAIRAVRKITEVITPAAQTAPTTPTIQNTRNTRTTPITQNTPTPRDTDIPTSRNGEQPTPATVSDASASKPTAPPALIPARPRHIDQYVHLLPEKTQERASHYRDLRRDIDTAREKLRLLMNDPHASAASREQWAKLITRLDNQVGSINRELDSEWEKLAKQGKVIVDDLGMAHVVDVPDPDPVPDPVHVPESDKVPVPDPVPEPDNAHDGTMPTSATATPASTAFKEAATLRRWLIDTRKAKNEEHDRKWREKYDEMVRLGGKGSVTDKVRSAARHYGIEITA